jgi:hypothetical protein
MHVTSVLVLWTSLVLPRAKSIFSALLLDGKKPHDGALAVFDGVGPAVFLSVEMCMATWTMWPPASSPVPN